MPWVVLRAMPKWLPVRMVALAARSAAMPCCGWMRKYFELMVLMLRLPPLHWQDGLWQG